MESISLIEHAWELHRTGCTADEIAAKIGKHRATIYRWLAGIQLRGIRAFLHRYRTAKQGRRQKRQTDPIIKARIYAIREEFRNCCGEKIRYWLQQRYGLTISVATIYRILGQKYQLRSKWKKNIPRGPVPKAQKQREVIQTDTVDFGELFAFTSIDIFTREASVVIRDGLDASDGAAALREQMSFFGGHTDTLQRDGGPEFKAEWNQAATTFCDHIRTARPYKKNEQAFIEVFNRTLRKECLGWTKYKKQDLLAVQAKASAFLDFYNNQRPHLSLNYQSPASYSSHLR